MLNKVERKLLPELLNQRYDCFICCASFEDRGLVVAKALDRTRFQSVAVLGNQPASIKSIEIHNQLLGLFPGTAFEVDTKIAQPLYTLDQFHSMVIPAIKKATKRALIDVTTFTHEHLLMLLYFLKNENLIDKVTFAYTGAQDYSLNMPIEEIWLTKGVKQVRSVIGFPGELVPSKDLHLIVLVGFEHERAQTVIEAYEPARLSLGFAPRLGSVSEQLSETNKAFFSRVQAFVKQTRQDTTRVDEFEFSCVDPHQARNAILNQVMKEDSYNTVICPLNTKISTIGAALAAFERSSIQLCYSEAAIYNHENYSSPGPTTTLFDLGE